MKKITTFLEYIVFRHRLLVILAFIVMTVLLMLQATQLKLDASFNKNIPLKHEYMQTYLKHAKDFGGANNILISVCQREGDIFNPKFFDVLKGVNDQLFFIPGVDRIQVKSLYSPSTRFTEVVEDGFAGGPVIPANFEATPAGLAIVKSNIEKAGIVGRMVADDYSCAMVSSQLQEVDPQTGNKLDTLKLAETLETDIREKFEDSDISIQIIGFAKVVGDVADGAKGVVVFFAIAIAITAALVFLFSKSVVLTLLPIICSVVAVIWQIGLLTFLGFGLDPMSILVPFLIFAIGVSHGVQMINAVGKKVIAGLSSKVAAQSAFVALLVPGGIALLSDTIGFLTLLTIDIGIIRELAITASLGVAVIILTNLVLLPVLLSFVTFGKRYIERASKPNRFADQFWKTMALFATKRFAVPTLIITSLLFVGAHLISKDMLVGDVQKGAAALHHDSRYNLDTAVITDKYAISVDVMSVIIEATPNSCTNFDVLEPIDRFQWQLENVPGVQSAISLASLSKRVNAGYNEGNPKWRIISRNQSSLVQSISRVPTSSGLLNSDCSVMPIILFLEDHKAETIERVVNKVKQLSAEMSTEDMKFMLASGPVGVMAATNEAVKDAQLPMLIYVYGAVILLCLVSFRSVRSTIAVVLPLFIVSTMAQALMTMLEIGLTVSTLPVIALGVGIGVDYGIYILSEMSTSIRNGQSLHSSYLHALKERGNAVLFTGVTLAIGVSTWFFSALKFQVDMGILLTFMFLVNMLGAIIVLPAIARVLWFKQGR